jgi:hypothetical protein
MLDTSTVILHTCSRPRPISTRSPSMPQPRVRSVGWTQTAARAYGALIAASALAEGIPLYTCNPADFRGIDGLDVRAVPHPDRG